jgi:hypothetical protein
MFDGMTTLLDFLPFASRVRLRAGDTFIARGLPAPVQGGAPSEVRG